MIDHSGGIDYPGAPIDNALQPDSRAAIYYAEICGELNGATQDVDAIINELLASVATELSGAESNTNSTIDEIIGAADLQLSDATNQLNRVLTNVYKDVNKQLSGAIDALGMVGFTLPYHTVDMANQANGDFLDLVRRAVPSFQPFMGEPTDATPGIAPSVGSYQPTVVLPTDGLPIDGSPTFSTYDPAQPTQTQAQPATAAGVCCPAPVNVTVNVPPIVLNAPVNVEPTIAPVVDPTLAGRVCVTPTDDLKRLGFIEFDPLINCWVWRRQPTPNIGPEVEPKPAPQPTAPQPTTSTGPSFGGSTPSSLLFPTVSNGFPTGTTTSINWNSLEACTLAGRVSIQPALNTAPAPEKKGDGPLEAYLKSKLSWQGMAGMAFIPFSGPIEINNLRKAWAASDSATTKTMESLAEKAAATMALDAVAPQGVPNPTAATYFGGRLAVANYAERQTTFPLSYLYQSDLYLYQYSNPQWLPNQIRVDAAFLMGQISEGIWECWTRANGNLPEPSRRVMLADQAKPGLAELIHLYMRGHLKKEDLPKRARDVGVLEPAYIPEWLALAKALPTQTDLVRFMVRDAADDKVALKYQYDKGFKDKYTDQIKAWADGLGLDETYFKYNWRVHWTVPSDTKLEEMFHRLRADRPEVLEWDQVAKEQGEEKAEALLGPRPPVVTLAEVREALEINDVAPRWVDAQIAVGYTPINRTDAVRAFQIGAFDEARLRDAFLDVGYSPADADTLVKYHSQDKARKRASVSGTWSVRKIVRYYKAGYLSREKAFELMRPLVANAQEVDRTLSAAEDEVAADTRAAAIKGVQRGFMSGEFSEQQARTLLAGFGADKGVSDKLIVRWTIERDSRYKRLSATQATDMLKRGLIGAEEFRRRLRNLGYAIRDADLITARALNVEGDTDGVEPAELDKAIGTAIRSRKEAAALSDSLLMDRLDKIIKEATRITSEVNKRRTDRGEDPIDWRQVNP